MSFPSKSRLRDRRRACSEPSLKKYREIATIESRDYSIMATITTVEMGETGLERAAGSRLQAFGLGACVGLCLYDTFAHVAVLVHVVLPQTLPAAAGRASPPPGKCADTALAHALAELARNGGQVKTIRAALIGGAQIFAPASSAVSNPSLSTVAPSRLEIGQRNVLALKEELNRVSIPLCLEETGGHGGRTVTFEVGTGNLWVRPVGLPERLLGSLARHSESASAAAAPLAALRSVQEGMGGHGH